MLTLFIRKSDIRVSLFTKYERERNEQEFTNSFFSNTGISLYTIHATGQGWTELVKAY